MSVIVRHAPDPLHARESLCGTPLVTVSTEPHWLATVGDTVNCGKCRVVINMVKRCISPHLYTLTRTP